MLAIRALNLKYANVGFMRVYLVLYSWNSQPSKKVNSPFTNIRKMAKGVAFITYPLELLYIYRSLSMELWDLPVWQKAGLKLLFERW